MVPIRPGLSETFCKQRKRVFKSALAFSAGARLAPMSRFHFRWASVSLPPWGALCGTTTAGKARNFSVFHRHLIALGQASASIRLRSATTPA